MVYLFNILLSAYAFLLKIPSTEGVGHEYTPPYLTLPPTPHPPRAVSSGYVPVSDGAKIFYSLFGKSVDPRDDDAPLLFLHGGFANLNYWGKQIRHFLDLNRTILALDTRGHGKSTDGTGSLTYDKFTDDVLVVLDHLKIPKVAIVGWSDGGIIGLDLAMNYSSRVDRLFAFGASYDPSNMQPTIGSSPVWAQFSNRIEREYKALNPHPNNFAQFSKKLNRMWSALPAWNAKSFAKIPTPLKSKNAPYIWMVDGANEEAITFGTPRQMHEWVPGSGLLILPDVSHFAFIQDPTTFNLMVGRWLGIQKPNSA